MGKSCYFREIEVTVGEGLNFLLEGVEHTTEGLKLLSDGRG